MKKTLSIAITLLMLVSGVFVIINGGAGSENSPESLSSSQAFINSLTSHAPIRINGNDNFTSVNGVTAGNGTEENPYIIENYEINGSGYGYCIYIGNTSSYFVIRNCHLYNADGGDKNSTYFSDSGLILYNVLHGTIFNNTIESNKGYGIHLYNSYFNNIKNSTVFSNFQGIYLNYSNYIEIENTNSSSNSNSGIVFVNDCEYDTAKNSTVFSNGYSGIFLSASPNNKLTNNTVNFNSYFGIKIISSPHNKLENSMVSNNRNGIHIESSSTNTISNNTVNSNSEYGIYLKSSSSTTLTNNIINLNNKTGIYVEASKSTISSNNINSNTNGVYILNSSSSTLDSNNVSNSTEYGIFIYNSNYTSIRYGRCHQNLYGIYILNTNGASVHDDNISKNSYGAYMLNSDKTHIYYNDIFENSEYGIFLNSSNNNTIYNNNFIGNSHHAYDGTGSTDWQYSYPTGGNFWDDYVGEDNYSGEKQDEPMFDGIGDSPYMNISGPLGVEDRYPLMKAWPFPNNVRNYNTMEYFDKIQDAIDDPDTQDGHLIEVRSGTYRECVDVTKALMIKGAGSDVTTIDAHGSWHAIHISSDNVRINGFTVINAGTFDAGVNLDAVRNCTVENITSTDNYYYGILVKNSQNNTILNCDLKDSDHNLAIQSSSNNTVMNNKISKSLSNGAGIWIYSSNNNLVTSNRVFENEATGIKIENSNSNVITNNTISSNGNYGLYCAHSEKNRIYHNKFINNSISSYDNTVTNWWNTSYPEGGNYWDDYNGTDIYSGPGQNESGSDGIGDTPYNVSGGDNRDMYPLMCMSIQVHIGWNLISLPWQTTSVNIENALYEISWDRAMIYKNGRWYTYNTARDGKYNIGFPMVNNTMGIWVHTTKNGTLLDSSKDIGITNINLYTGWNLVGYPSNNHTRTVADALSGVSYDYVQVYNTTSGQIETLVSSDIMQPGKGYWIHVTADCIWTVEW